MKKNNLRTKNPRKGQSYQQKVNSFAIYIAFLLLLLLLFLLFTGKGQPLRKTRTAKPKPKIMTDAGPTDEELFRCIYCHKDFAKRNYLLNQAKNALQRKWNWGNITPIPTGGAKMTEHTYVSMNTAMAHIPLQDPSGLITTNTMD